MMATAASDGGLTRMFWEVVVPGEDGTSSSTVTVEAENWFSALRSSLVKHGSGGQLISNLTCDIKPDRSVHVTDFVTRKVFTLKPLDRAPAAGAADRAALISAVEAPPSRPAGAPDSAVDGLPPDVPSCRGFFRRDEAPDDLSGIFYRERNLAVAPGTDTDSAARLAMVVFERLQALGNSAGTKLFVIVQVFDHEFEGRFVRPAIAALEWKEWSPKKAKIRFPLSGAEEMRIGRTSIAPPAPEAALPIELVEASQPAAAPAVLAPRTGVRPSVDAVASAPRPAVAPVPLVAAPDKAVPLDLRPATSPAQRKAPVEAQAQPAKELYKKHQTGEGVVLDDLFFQAFERMHEIYSYRDHDKVAEFALKLAQEFIKSEAGSTMLITPGKYELYVAAAQGSVAQSLFGKRMSLTKGIVGFATRAGAVVTVSDPENDPRFHDEFDKLTSFKTRNVVCAPIQFEGKTIGAIELLNSPRESGFLQTEANVLSYIAGAVGEYIDTSLPSREAEFSDKEFAEFLPARKRAEAVRRGLEKKNSKPSPKVVVPAAQAKVASTPVVRATIAETPAAKRTLPPPDKSSGKNKKKRKR
jgi:putative methionine-R-sulfoxide reductase with GAF domain